MRRVFTHLYIRIVPLWSSTKQQKWRRCVIEPVPLSCQRVNPKPQRRTPLQSSGKGSPGVKGAQETRSPRVQGCSRHTAATLPAHFLKRQVASKVGGPCPKLPISATCVSDTDKPCVRYTGKRRGYVAPDFPDFSIAVAWPCHAIRAGSGSSSQGPVLTAGSLRENARCHLGGMPRRKRASFPCPRRH
jgi:hypothetical protein